MTNVIAFQKPAPASISPALRAQALAWLLRERDAVARAKAELQTRIDRLDATLANVTGRNKEN